MEELPSNVLPISPRQQAVTGKRPKAFKCALCYVLISILFSAAIWFSGRTGVALALRNLPVKGAINTRFPDGQKIDLGGRDTPLYLADSPESLRDFYLNFSDEESRINATDLADYGIRRVFGQLEMTIQRYDADAVQVKIGSGSISGAIYWIDIKLLQDIPGTGRDKDTIIEPIPSR